MTLIRRFRTAFSFVVLSLSIVSCATLAVHIVSRGAEAATPRGIEAAREAFEAGLYREAQEFLREGAGGPEAEFLQAACAMRIASLQNPRDGVEFAQVRERLLVICEGPSDRFAARAYAELVRAGLSWDPEVEVHRGTAFDHWQTATDLGPAAEGYADLALAFVQAGCDRPDLVEPIWSDLVAVGADLDLLDGLATTVLRDCAAGHSWTARLWSEPSPLVAAVSRHVVARPLDASLRSLAHAWLARAAEGQQRFDMAADHYEEAIVLSSGGGAEKELSRRRDAIVDPLVQVSTPERVRSDRPTVAQLRWRNLSSWSIRVLRVDVRDADRSISPDAKTVELFRPDTGQEVLRVDRVDEAERFARRGGATTGRHRWRDEAIAIGDLDPGVYVVEATGRSFRDEERVERSTIIVSDVGLVLLPGTGGGGDVQHLLWVAEMNEGAPVEGTTLDVVVSSRRSTSATWSEAARMQGRTDEDGLLAIRSREESQSHFLILGTWKGHPILARETFYSGSTGPRPPEDRGFFWTDRPLYQPGETVHMQAFLRRLQWPERELMPRNGAEIEVRVESPRGEPILERKVRLDENGSFDLSLSLGKHADVGEYRVTLREADRLLLQVHGSFQVDEFRPPEFEVDVEFDTAQAVLGDTLRVEAKAEYLFGGPVEGRARVVVFRQPAWSVWPARTRMPWLLEPRDSRFWPPRSPHAGGEKVADFEADLDEKGELAIAIPTASADESMEYRYDVEVRVLDASRREEVGRASRHIGAREFVAFLRTDRTFVASGEAVGIELRTQDFSAHGVVREGRWWVEKILSSGAARTLQSNLVSTDSQGEAQLEFTPDQDGSYRVRFESFDRRGQRVVAETLVRVLGDAHEIPVETEGLQLLVEREEFTGDRARLLLLSDVPGRHVLLTRSDAGRTATELVRMTGNAHLIEFSLGKEQRPVTEWLAVSLHDHRMLTARAAVIAPDPSRLLDVQLRFAADEVGPGQTIPLEILARDAAGNPVSTVLAFAVVDEAVLALLPRSEAGREESLFRLPRPEVPFPRWLTPVARSGEPVFESVDQAVLGRAMEGAGGDVLASAALRQPAGTMKSASSETLTAAKIRSDFRFTALWKTGVRTDAEGRAVLDVPLAESLTRWRATGIALDSSNRFGRGEAFARTRKPLMVRLQHPRVLRERDRLEFVAVVHNESDRDRKATVTLEHDLRGVVTGSREVVVPRGSSARVSWTADLSAIEVQPRIERDDQGRIRRILPAQARLVLRAEAEGLQDALERWVSLLPFGTPSHRSRMLELAEGRQRLRLDLPADRVQGTETVTLTVAPSLLATCVQALPYLADYPYGCVEQTLSRFVPSLAVREVAQAMGLDTRSLDPELEQKIAEGLDRVLGMRHPNGAWGWWKEGTDHPYITAHVLLTLSRARRAGVEVPESVLADGARALRGMLDEIRNRDDEAYALLALVESEAAMATARTDAKPLRERAARLHSERDRLSAYARALVARVLFALGDSEGARTLVRHLEYDVREDAALGTASWGRPAGYSWRGDGAVETTAFVLQALVNISPDHPLREKAARWLAFNRRGHRWDSTRSTAHAIYALCDHLESSGRLVGDFELIVRGGGSELLRLNSASVGVGGGRYSLPATVLGQDRAGLEFESSGEVHPWVTLEVDSVTRAATIRSAGNVLRVQRSVELLRSVRTLGKGFVLRTIALQDGTEIQAGDRLRVRLELEAHHDVDFVVVEDPRPAGCEPVDRLSGHFGGWGVPSGRREVREGHTAFFLDALQEGEHVLEYELVAETSGVYHVQPARALAMYLPDIVGNSASSDLRVGN